MKTAVSQDKVKVALVVGTRPEAIKMAPIIHEFRARKKSFDLTVLNTAQHREMVDQVFAIYNIRPDIDLDIMEENQTLATVFTKSSKALEEVFKTYKPHVLLIQGDTSTVFVASLMAFYNRIDVAHVEAGLRTFDIYNPFPEEVNRRITSVLCQIHFAPTEWAKTNLIREGYRPESIFVTGNPVIDTLLKATKSEHKLKEMVLESIDYEASKIVLVTAHRRENHGKPLENICNAILQLTHLEENLFFVYPIHPNPNVKKIVEPLLGGKQRIFLMDPLDYLSFVHIMKRAYVILSDSGGIQEEAPTLGKPVLVLREVTERPEALDAGTAKVIGTDTNKIVSEVLSLVHNRKAYDKMVVSENPFGDGKASKRIVDIIGSRYSTG